MDAGVFFARQGAVFVLQLMVTEFLLSPVSGCGVRFFALSPVFVSFVRFCLFCMFVFMILDWVVTDVTSVRFHKPERVWFY